MGSLRNLKRENITTNFLDILVAVDKYYGSREDFRDTWREKMRTSLTHY